MDGKHFATLRLGWTFQNGMLIPVETDLPVATENLLNIVSCGCTAAGCGMSWGCRKLGLFCISLCMKCSGETCSNAQLPTFDIDEEESTPALLDIGDGDFEDEPVD